MNALIIGGSSGLGLELGKILAETHQVFITGRKDPRQPQLRFMHLDIKFFNQLPGSLDEVIKRAAPIDLLVYAAGFYQDGLISDLGDSDIEAMINVGLTAPAMLLQRILRRQEMLHGFIAITSSSQETPRLREPMYTAIKAGLGMLANSVSFDRRVGKTLVAAPAGMKTSFWKGIKRKGILLDPGWVAERIFDLYRGKFTYKHARLLRNPSRIEVIGER